MYNILQEGLAHDDICIIQGSDSFIFKKGVPMYGSVLGRNVTVGAAAVLPATGSNRTVFIAAGILFVAGLVTMVVSKLVAAKAN